MDGMNTSPIATGAGLETGATRRRVFLFVNGIHVLPGDAEGWTDRAVTWTHIHTEARGEKFEYATTFATRLLFQEDRAGKFARMIQHYTAAKDQWEINLVGHSNGCDIILRALRGLFKYSMRPTPINALHLLAAACEADFEKNGLNEFLAAGFVRRVEVYVGGQDRAMQWAWASKFSPLRFLRFGDLGRTGPIHPRYLRVNAICTHTYRQHDHSTWFERDHLDETMRAVTDTGLPNEMNRAERVSAQAAAPKQAGDPVSGCSPLRARIETQNV